MNGVVFERFTERARRTLFFSRYEASLLGSVSIETEHMLLGILRENKPFITHLLKTAGVTAVGLRKTIAAHPRKMVGRLDTSLERPFSNDVKQVLERAVEEANRLQDDYIGFEHLLLGLLRVERGIAWDVLCEHGLSLASVRDAINATSPPPSIEAMLRVPPSSEVMLARDLELAHIRRFRSTPSSPIDRTDFDAVHHAVAICHHAR